LIFGIIGLGNIGNLFLKGVLNLGFVEKIFVNDKISEKLEKARNLDKVEVFEKPEKVCQNSDFILLAVKPQDFEELFEKIESVDFSEKVIISPITGIEIQKLKKLKNSKNIVRIMLNLPCYIGKGSIGVAYSNNFDMRKKGILLDILKEFGEAVEFDEKRFSALTSFIGSAPGIIFLLIEAFIDSGIKLGFSYEQSKKITLQNLIGSSKIIETMNKEPSELKRMVCSPAGTTIEAIYCLEKNGIRGKLMEAFFKAFEKAQDFEKGVGAK